MLYSYLLLSVEPLVEFGYNIDVNYKPFLPVERLLPNENFKDYYQRSFQLIKHLANVHLGEGSYLTSFHRLNFF